MRFALAVVHAVDHVDAAAEFLVAGLGFRERERRTDSVVVENGAIAVRLLPCASPQSPGTLELEVSTRDIHASMHTLLAWRGVSVLEPESRPAPERAEARLAGPHGVMLRLTRTFDEDELGVLPPLPTALVWNADAEERIKRLLRSVPVAFRDQARRRVTRVAEEHAGARGLIEVDMSLALQGLVDATPPFQHRTLREALQAEGVDPDPLFDALEDAGAR